MIDVTSQWHNRTRGGGKVEKVEEIPPRTGGETISAHVIEGRIEAWRIYFADGRYLHDKTHALDLIPIDQKHPLGEPKPVCDCGKIEHGRHHADCPVMATQREALRFANNPTPAPTPEPGPRVVRFDGPSGPVYIRADRVSAIGQSDVSKSLTWVSLGDKRSDPRGDGDGAEMFWIIGTPDRVAAALWPGAVFVEVGK